MRSFEKDLGRANPRTPGPLTFLTATLARGFPGLSVFVGVVDFVALIFCVFFGAATTFFAGVFEFLSPAFLRSGAGFRTPAFVSLVALIERAGFLLAAF